MVSMITVITMMSMVRDDDNDIKRMHTDMHNTPRHSMNVEYGFSDQAQDFNYLACSLGA